LTCLHSASKFLGKRSAAIYLLSLSACALLAGLVLNAWYVFGNLDIRTHLGTAGEIVPQPARLACAFVLLFFMILCNLRKTVKEKAH
jgi:hypothetical protein